MVAGRVEEENAGLREGGGGERSIRNFPVAVVLCIPRFPHALSKHNSRIFLRVSSPAGRLVSWPCDSPRSAWRRRRRPRRRSLSPWPLHIQFASTMSPYNKRQATTTTTTLISVPTIAISSNGSGVSVPVAAIVGGVCAGVVLAIAAVLGWKLWGRSIERQQQAERDQRVRYTVMLMSFRAF